MKRRVLRKSWPCTLVQVRLTSISHSDLLDDDGHLNALCHCTRQVMLGGAWFNECFGDVDNCDIDAIVDTAINAVASQLHVHQQPTNVTPHLLKVSPVCMLCIAVAR